ncbi:ankyrin repeat and socs box protein [Anaeramoeba flamelloides]|uniref:Ankyrin repeat and socs box protein n=1 Tax=Anaeramoeba flamelloides TaxID=1746091 RepID=A0AAV7ZN44_9EUKA|nr:ankyrin repeat and socs box protein [Anaeramoeba flamelloides]
MSKRKQKKNLKQHLNPLLWYLCTVGDHKRLSLLLGSINAKKENLLHSKSPTGDTGLHYCVSGVKPNFKCLDLMLSNRSNPNTKNKMDFSPLHIACAKGFTNCVSELLENGSDPDLVTKQGYRPIHYATMGGHIECVELLIKKKSKLTTQYDKMSLLMLAAKYGFSRLIVLLINSGCSVNFQSFDGTTALHIAAENGHNKCCKLLIENGANVGSLNVRNHTPLHIATKQHHLATVKLLIQYNSDPNSRDRNLETPLHISVRNSNLKLSQILLDSRAIPHLKNFKGQTPLHLAANNGDTNLFILLVDREANLFEPDNSGNGPYNYLLKKGHNDLLLIAFDVCLINAAFFNFKDIVEKLLNMGADPNGSNFCSYIKKQQQSMLSTKNTQMQNKNKGNLSSHVKKSSPLAFSDQNLNEPNLNSSNVNNHNNETSLNMDDYNEKWTEKINDFSFLNNRFSNSIVSSIFGQNTQITEKLIACLGNINTLDLFTGDTCLHKAVMTNNIQIIKFCLERGVEQFNKNKAGLTAKQLANKLSLTKCNKYLHQAEEIYVNLLPGDKTPRVICGTTDRTIERFLINQEFDSKFCYYFLLMHRYFCDTENLIQLLINLFLNAKEFIENCLFFFQINNKIKFVRSRIIKIFQLWVEKIHPDFIQDKETINKLLIPFLNSNLKNYEKMIKPILDNFKLSNIPFKKDVSKSLGNFDNSNLFLEKSMMNTISPKKSNKEEEKDNDNNNDDEDDDDEVKNSENDGDDDQVIDDNENLEENKYYQKPKSKGNNKKIIRSKPKKIIKTKQNKNSKLSKSYVTFGNLTDSRQLHSKETLEPRPKSLITNSMRKKIAKKKKNVDFLMEINPLELARQISLIEFKYYSKIGIIEFKNWTLVSQKKENKKQFPNFYNYDQHSHCFIHWIIYQVVKEKKKSKRIKRLIRLIEIAKHLRELQNFSTLIQILEAFTHTPLARLIDTWNKIGKYSKTLNDLKKEVVELLLQSQYKAFFLQTPPPCIPHLENFLDDLIDLDLKNKTKIGKIIHFDNYRRQFELLELVKKFQYTPYNFEPIQEIQDQFDKIKLIPFKRLSTLSFMCKK